MTLQIIYNCRLPRLILNLFYLVKVVIKVLLYYGLVTFYSWLMGIYSFVSGMRNISIDDGMVSFK